MNKIILENINQYILKKSIELIGHDNCADLSCNNYTYNTFISQLESFKVKDSKCKCLDYNIVKLWINTQCNLKNNEILIGNDIGVNEHLINLMDILN